LMPFLGQPLLANNSVLRGIQTPLLEDLRWACKELQEVWNFEIGRPRDHVSISSNMIASPTLSSQPAPSRSNVRSRVPRGAVASLEGIASWPASTSFPKQHNISHFISAVMLHELETAWHNDSRELKRLHEVRRYQVPAHMVNSPLSFAPASSRQQLTVSPRALMSLTTTYFLDNDDFLDLEALFLGLPVPCITARPLSSQDCCLGDLQFASSTYAGFTRKKSHDALAHKVGELATRCGYSGVQTVYSRIPTTRCPGHETTRGDIYVPSGLQPQRPRQPFVLDIRMGHLFTGHGLPVSSLFGDISHTKMHKYAGPYHARGISFAALPVSTFLGLGPEVCHLFQRLASAPSETCLDRSGAPAPWKDDPGHGIRYSHLVREFQYFLALATLLRLRGKDDFIPASASDDPRDRD
jgi:hypothetical protein